MQSFYDVKHDVKKSLDTKKETNKKEKIQHGKCRKKGIFDELFAYIKVQNSKIALIFRRYSLIFLR